MIQENPTTERVDVAFRYSALGDLVLCSGFVKKHSHVIQCPLYFVTQSDFLPIVKNHFPNENSQLNVVTATIKGWKGLWNAFTLGFRLSRDILAKHDPKEVNFYDLHNIPKSHAFGFGLWLGFCKSPTKVLMWSNSKESLSRWISILCGRDLMKPRWVYQEHQTLLEQKTHYTPQLCFKNPVVRENIILLAPAASKWKKEWPASKWEELARHLKNHFSDFRICVVSPPNHALTRAFKTSLAALANAFEWHDDLSIEELPSFAASATACICSNSAWLHLCEASQTPVVALEGPIVDGFGFSPWLAQSQSLKISDLKCRPCSKHGGGNCRLRGKDFHACMTRIQSSDVLLALHKVLASRPS